MSEATVKKRKGLGQLWAILWPEELYVYLRPKHEVLAAMRLHPTTLGAAELFMA